MEKKEIRFSYTIKYFIATQFLNFGMRADLFIVSFFAGFTSSLITKADVGYYGLANRIVLIVVTSIVSITQVLSPGFNHITNKKDALNQFKHGLLYMLLPLGAYAVLVITPPFIFNLFFTQDFTQTASLSHLLTIPYIIYTLSQIPLLFLLYTIKKPGYILLAYIVFFTAVVLGSFGLIPFVGVAGAPYAVLVGFGLSFILLLVPTVRYFQKLPER